MPTSALEFRPATAADVDAAVPLIHSSGPATFDYVFAPREAVQSLHFLAAAFRDGAGEFGWRNHVVGVRDGTVVAAGAAWDAASTFAFMRAATRQILGGYGLLRGAAVIGRGLAVERVIRPPADGELYVAHLGVRPELRGTGIGAALVRHLLARATPDRHRRASLDVALTNPRAQALYERLGFRVVAERAVALGAGQRKVPGHRRMVLEVGA
ncbi:MAG: GNAT family N-acetyltransferase [Proteobacteria bacterium]|nr:GNAT family N-acetyltransferase [Pseudomonadota bacterium]